MKKVLFVQARMGSTRLPGKVLMDLAGEPMLARVMSRCRRASCLDEVVVATTTRSADDLIVEQCIKRRWPYYRGSEEDCLDRFYRASLQFKADLVVRITSDCPFIEPELIDLTVKSFLEIPGLDYVSNTLPPRTYPRGLDVEVIAFAALEQAWRDDVNPDWREHVTPYIYRFPETFRLLAVRNEVDYSDMRWTVDTPEDLAFARKIYEYFGHDGFPWREILVLLARHPQWLEINRHVVQKEVS